MRIHIIPILAATVWISVSEFFRNEFWLKHVWVEHFAGLGLDFPGSPLNNAAWGLWSLLLAISIYVLLTRFRLIEATAFIWLMGFVLMWVVTGNLGVLPFSILIYAVPLSLLEVFVAGLIITALSRRSQ